MVKLLVTGDFCPIGKVEEILVKNSEYDLFGDFRTHIENVDWAITNLECPVATIDTPTNKIGPALKAHPVVLRSLANSGFKAVTLANNHIMDHGVEGLNSTLEHLKGVGIDYVGAGMDQASAERPMVFGSGGLKVGLLNFAENEFVSTGGFYPGCNTLNPVRNYYQIRNTKKVVDVLIVIVHGGNENFGLPSPRLKDTFRYFVDVGADVVIAHHTHCFNGYETYKDKLIFYGIGNFVFDYNRSNDVKWSLGVAVELEIDGNRGLEFRVVPFYQNYKGHIGLRKLDSDELKLFEREVQWKNSVIQNDLALRTEFNSFIQSVERQYRHFLQPYSNKYLHKLYSLGLIPSVLRAARKRLLFLNLVRCESHRDVILELLNDEAGNS